MVGDAAENIPEPRKRIDLYQFAGSDEAAQHRCRFAPVVAAEEGPVVASDREAPQRSLGGIVIEHHQLQLIPRIRVAGSPLLILSIRCAERAMKFLSAVRHGARIVSSILTVMERSVLSRPI
jgi:hypothetical protein